MSHEQQILNYLESGKAITPIEALNEFGCFRLAARIYDLRCKNYKIHTAFVKKGSKEFARYSLL